MPIRITGLNSGLDTEAIISALVSSYNYKTEKYKKAQTKLMWKQEKWKTLNAKIYSLYKSLDSMRFSTGYNLKSVKVSDATKATVTGGSSAPNGTQRLNILKVAQAGYLSGGKLDSGVTTSSTLAELGYTGGDGKITVTKGDGTTKQITVSQGTTVNDFLSSLKDAGLNANFDATNHRIYVSSKETGVENDFTLTGANADGINALTRMGLNVQSDASDATYASYQQYVTADGQTVSDNVKKAIEAYRKAQEDYATAAAQNKNMTDAYGYASAYSAMMDALQGSGLSDTEQKQLQTLLGMSASGRTNSVMDASGTVYTRETVDKNGDTIYKDASGNLIKGVTTYTGDNGKELKLNANGTYEDATTGKVYAATSEKDEDGNTIYKAEDGSEEKITVSSKTEYYTTVATEQDTEFVQYKDDATGASYAQVEGNKYTGSDGKIYRKDDNTNTLIEIDRDGNDVDGGNTVTLAGLSPEKIKETVYTGDTIESDVARSADKLTALKEKANLTDDDLTALTSNVQKVNAYEQTTDSVSSQDYYSRAKIAERVKAAYASGSAAGVNAEIETYGAQITANKTAMQSAEATMTEHQVLADIAKMDPAGAGYDDAVQALVDQVQNIAAMGSIAYNTDANKVDGSDAEIVLNGVTYTNSKNTFSINGLNITAQGVTGAGDENAITVTTDTDVQGIYDKIKNFLTQYNTLINEITSLYNADSAKGYEPLTSEEKDAMSDTDIELWEDKIKSSLLRRDDKLSSVMNAMTSAMSQGVSVGGKTYYLGNFGISTLGYLNAAENEQYAYHIDGDEDDTSVSGKTDRLMTALMNDPDQVTEFMQGLTNNLYNSLDKMMRSSTLSSVYTVYNDKEMASEYSDYTDLIKKWEDKLTTQEDYWYNKFAQMEKALASLNSQSSSLSGLFGG